MRRLIAEADRWRVVLPQGSMKGISQIAAHTIAAERDGTVEHSWVRLYDDGVEELGPWEAEDAWVRPPA